MSVKIAVEWLDREGECGPKLGMVWCRAARKTTTTYQDNVKTACGMWVVLPCGLSKTEAVTCPDCKAKEARSR